MFKELGRHMEEIKWPKVNYYTKKPVMYMVKKKKKLDEIDGILDISEEKTELEHNSRSYQWNRKSEF